MIGNSLEVKDTLTILKALELANILIHRDMIVLISAEDDKECLSKKQIDRVISLLTIKDRE